MYGKMQASGLTEFVLLRCTSASWGQSFLCSSCCLHSSSSCLENSMDRQAWWAAVLGVTQGWTPLKWFSMPACIGEGNGNPLQYSCLEDPRDRGAWWAAILGVAQSQARLKRLSSNSCCGSSPEITDDCDISCLLLWQEIFSFRSSFKWLAEFNFWRL